MSNPIFQNQGHMIALGWDAQASLKNFTAYFGTDGRRFPPPSDRSGYTDGVDRALPTGKILMAGLPVVRLTFPWLSYGQVDYLIDTFDNVNVTVAIHKPSSLTKTDTFNYNAVSTVDQNQFQSLTRRGNGYEGVVLRLVLVEAL